MTNEAVLLRETHIPISFTVADGTGILKGTLLKLTEPNTCAISAVTNDVVAGIAAQEKISENGQTKLAVYNRGDFRGIASGNILYGSPIGLATDSLNPALNYIYSLSGVANLSGQCCLGVARETATDEQTFRFELNPQVITTV